MPHTDSAIHEAIPSCANVWAAQAFACITALAAGHGSPRQDMAVALRLVEASCPSKNMTWNDSDSSLQQLALSLKTNAFLDEEG